MHFWLTEQQKKSCQNISRLKNERKSLLNKYCFKIWTARCEAQPWMKLKCHEKCCLNLLKGIPFYPPQWRWDRWKMNIPLGRKTVSKILRLFRRSVALMLVPIPPCLRFKFRKLFSTLRQLSRYPPKIIQERFKWYWAHILLHQHEAIHVCLCFIN